MKKLIALFAMATIFISCSIQPESTIVNQPNKVLVSKIITLDSTYTPGVYRFEDGGDDHYFVIAPKCCQTTYQIPKGKYSTPETIQTISDSTH